jgi:thiosulfate dehydrogenase [quinone] large subunit
VSPRSLSTVTKRKTSAAKLKSRLRSGSALRSPAWALVPLRAFLGGTFLYAGLSKVLDRQYLDYASPLGVHAQMVHAAATSPIGVLVSLSAHYSAFTGTEAFRVTAVDVR